MADKGYEEAEKAMDSLLACDTRALKVVMRKYRLYKKGLFQHCAFKKGDRVIIAGFIYGNKSRGAYAGDPSLMRGTAGTVVDVDWREYRKKEGGYFCCMFEPDFVCWVNRSVLRRPGWKNAGELGELGEEGLPLTLSSDHHQYFVEEKNLKHPPEGYDESTLVECRTCGWRGPVDALDYRPPEGYNHMKHWCPAEGCDNFDGGYPDERGFEIIESPALRWSDRHEAEGESDD